MEFKIVVIVPFFNTSSYISKCYNSLISQQFNNYTLIFSDDCSKDETLQMIPDGENVIKIRRNKRVFALENIYRVLSEFQFEGNDIIVLVDGDDYLMHDKVFKTINQFYEGKKCLLTYGQYCTTSGSEGHCTAYTESEFSNLRKLDFRASHLKTFQYKLYEEFLRQDPNLNAYRDKENNFYSMTYDVALMHPLMEIAGWSNVFFNKDVVYTYREHSLNDMNIDRNLQINFEKHIQSKEAFKRLF